jgi:beta-N-acetylhexosaminidase
MIKPLKVAVITFLLLTLTATLWSEIILPYSNNPVENPAERHWVDSVMQKLTPDQRLAQLFMVAAYSNKTLQANSTVTDLIQQYNIGGICFFQGGPVTQARYTNYWQSIAKTPLLISIDGEWGLGMRLKDSTVSFPKQMTLGAITDTKLIYNMGVEIARQCKRLGIHINFAPVADINSNPKNPVINYRSFGEERSNVASKTLAYMKGMQDNGVLACAKHFPGHGDTDKDSHKTLPIINHSRATIDSIDLYPFRELIKNGIASIMCAHLLIPALDSTPDRPSSLSPKIVRDILIKQLGFKGLIFTDALNMKGASNVGLPGNIELSALQAGNDILLMPENVPLAINFIKAAITKGQIAQKDIDDKCRKVLIYKYRAGLSKLKPVAIKNIYTDLNNLTSDILNLKLHEASLTLLKNNNSIIPLKNLENQKIASISFNATFNDDLDQTLDYYAPMQHYSFDKTFTADSIPTLKQQLLDRNLVIITINQTANSAIDNYGLSDDILAFIKDIKITKRVIINLLANPYSLDKLSDTSDISAILVAYQSNKFSQQASAEAIFGGIPVTGKLPVTASAIFPLNSGFNTYRIRLDYTFPANAGMDNEKLMKIDSIALKGIADTIFPGCQILIARNGSVVYHKSFGFHTYDKMAPVKNSDLYDIASITKIAATTISVMKLYEEGKISVDSALVKYLPGIDNSNKAQILLKNLMTHQAGLKAWIPYHRKMIINGYMDTNIFRKQMSAEFPVRVAEGIYISKYYEDTIFHTIIHSELRTKHNYLYSDLGFYLLKVIIEKQVNEGIDQYVKKNFYGPLGLTTLCYEPRRYINLSRIVPSEIDTAFRHQLLQGDVNDPGAALLGGIGGHAGLFSNSNDLVILMQMMLQKGEYGGRRYFKPETVNKFTAYQFSGNRRGLGFDKPVREKGAEGPTCDEASPESYGHSGFTGTFVWVDPKYQLVYVFLSNRTYPSSANNKLLSSGIRSKIQKIIYQSIESK